MVTMKYVDTRPIYFPKLSYYPGGLTLPNKDNIVKFSDGEAKHQMKQKNGKKFCFEVIEDTKLKKEPKIKNEENNIEVL